MEQRNLICAFTCSDLPDGETPCCFSCKEWESCEVPCETARAADKEGTSAPANFYCPHLKDEA